MVNQPLFALKLSFALLVVYPQVLVFDLQFVVELLDFTEMFRIIFDGEGLTQRGEFILQAFVVVAKVSHLLSILLLGKLVRRAYWDELLRSFGVASYIDSLLRRHLVIVCNIWYRTTT